MRSVIAGFILGGAAASLALPAPARAVPAGQSADETHPSAPAARPTVAATAPSTQPATKPADELAPASTPKEALRSLNLALRDGDAAAIRSLFDTRDDQGRKFVTAMADYAAALVDLHKSAEQAYGPAGANSVTGDLAAQSSDGLAAIEQAEVSQAGDSADIKFKGATDPAVRLVKVDGRWRLPLSQLLDGADAQTTHRRMHELSIQATLARQTAEEIAGGKYREGPAKAAEVWRSRLLMPQPN